jgi:hypothetical protein
VHALADSSPWPILIFWGVFALLARAARKKAQPTRQPLAPRTDEGAKVEPGDTFQRAMVKLRQAEQEAQARGRRAPPVRTARPSIARAQKPATAYDEDAVRLEESRVKEEADAFERIEAPPSPRLIVNAPALAAAPSVQAPFRRSVLARFADGSLGGAIVLAEILGRPKSDR